MRNFFLLTVLVFVLGLFAAYRVQNFSNQNSQVLEYGPIDLEITLETSPKISNQFQIIEIGYLKVFTDIYPRFAAGDVLKISGEANSEGLMFRPKIEKIGRKTMLLGYLADLRGVISQNIDRLMPSKEATLVKGMVLGVDEIEKNFREALIETGTIHAVVVSGQNLSIVAGFFMVFVKYLGRRLSLFITVFAVFLYAGLTGFEVPVIRALIMVILSSIGVYLGRERLVIWNLFLAALIIILIWPGAVFDVSFQLTFAATLGIMTMGQKIGKLSRGFSKKISNLGILSNLSNLLIQNAAVATSAYLFTAPVIFWHFERISLIAPLVNVLVAEAVVPIMVLGFLVSLASLIFMPLAQILAYFAFVPAFYFVKTVEIFSRVF